MKLVVVGSVGLDDVETPFGKVERALGGSATYFSLSASYFARTGFVGVVGRDWPEEANTLLASRGVDLTGLERADGLTFRWAGRYGFDLNSRDTLLTELNVFADFNPVLPDDYRSARYLFLGNIHPELQLRVLEQSTSAEFVALDTMNFWISGTPEPLRRVLSRVHGLHESPLAAVSSLGVRPTVEDAGRVLLETHCLAWPPSLGEDGGYRRCLRVELLHKLHDERRYASLEALRDGIAQDLEDARAWHRAAGG